MLAPPARPPPAATVAAVKAHGAAGSSILTYVTFMLALLQFLLAQEWIAAPCDRRTIVAPLAELLDSAAPVAPSRGAAMLITLQVRTAGSSAALKTKLLTVEPDAKLLSSYASPLIQSCSPELALQCAVACTSLATMDAGNGIEIDLGTLQNLTAHDLVERTSCKFLLLRCVALSQSSAAPAATPLPSALQTLMNSSQQQAALHLPPLNENKRYDFVIYNALIRRLEQQGLGVHAVAVDSMQVMLTAVAGALQYLLPFDDAVSDERPRGQLRARGMKLPARLTTRGLALEPRSFGHHEAIDDANADARLSRETIEKHADSITRKLGECSWLSKPRWKSGEGKAFVDDIVELGAAMAKKVLDMVKQVEQVQAVHSAAQPVRSPGSGLSPPSYDERPASEEPTALRYQPLSDRLGALGDDYLNKIIIVEDTLMGIDLRSSYGVKSNARKQFIESLCFQESAIAVYVYDGGGPYPKMVQVWAINQPVSPNDKARMLAQANSNIVLHATRQMKREFQQKMSPAQLEPAMLRKIWATLDQPILPDLCMSEAVDDRLLEWMAINDPEAECFYDLRSMNGKAGDQFATFWAETTKFLSLEVGEGAHERRAAGSQDVSFAPRTISVPILIREVTKRLHAQPGHEEDPIPGVDCVRLQFTPNNPFKLASAKSTGILKFHRKIQTRCLRKWHEDSLWCLTHHKYAKEQVVETRNALREIGLAHAVHAAHLDDKCKIPQGPPGLPLAATSRGHVGGGARGSFVRPGETLGAADHDHVKQGSITPSVTLLGAIPEEACDSWFAGQIVVDLRDSVFEGSDPMLHMANLLEYMRARERAAAEAQQAAWQARQTSQIETIEQWLQRDEAEVVLELQEGDTYAAIRGAKAEELGALKEALDADRKLDGAAVLRKWVRPLVVWITADGGADHNIQFLAVKLSLLAFRRCIGAAKVSALRGCPHQSYYMTCEKAMSLLHLGIVNVSLARARMPDEFEDMVKNCSSMNDIREAAGMARKGRSVKLGSAKRTGGASSSAAAASAAGGAGAGAGAGADADDGVSGEEGEEAGEHEIEEVLNMRQNARSGREEYLVRWASDQLEDSWEPVSVLSHAMGAIAAYLAKRAREAAEATAAAAAEKDRALKQRQEQLRELWPQSVEEGSISVVRDQFKRLELKGVPVQVPPTAAQSTLDELHASLRAIDPAYDPKFRSMKDLAKMPVLKALFEDAAHCFAATYAHDLLDCGDPSCRFGCSDWLADLEAGCTARGCDAAKVDAAVHAVRRRSVLPMATRKGDAFVPYGEASKLPATDERDLPSRAAALGAAKKSEVRKRQEAADKAKAARVGERIFHVSKVRAVIFCDGCSRPRVLYANKKPSAPLLARMDAYAETISYMCGDPLFEEDLEDEALVELKDTFFVKEAVSCEDPVERDFFNTGGVGGRTEFEYICSICGADPEASPLVADAVLGMRDGLKLLPICEECHGDPKLLKQLRTYGRADQPKAQAAKRRRKEEAAASSSAKRPAAGSAGGERGRGGRGRGSGRGRGRGGRGRGGFPPDSSDEEAAAQGPLPPRPGGKKRGGKKRKPRSPPARTASDQEKSFSDGSDDEDTEAGDFSGSSESS